QVVIGRPPGVAAAAAVADHAEIDDRRLGLADRVVTQAEALKRRRPDIRDEGIGAARQPQDRIARLGLLEVQRNRALAARIVLEAAAHAAVAGVVAVTAGIALRRFDLDHLGAEVGDDAGAPRA